MLFWLSFNCFDLFWFVLGKSESYFRSFSFILAFFDLFLVSLEVAWGRFGYLYLILSRFWLVLVYFCSFGLFWVTLTCFGLFWVSLDLILVHFGLFCWESF